jgi:ribonuclease HI
MEVYKKIDMAKPKAVCYAYYLIHTKTSHIVSTWKECEQAVKGKDARYRGFGSRAEASAWLAAGAPYEAKQRAPKPELEPGIYFDAGTGRGKGVEVRVTTKEGKDLLPELLSKKELTEFKTFRVAHSGATNNYGELLGCYFALQLAEKLNEKKIFGDSRLIIDYWSKGFMKKEKIAKQTQELMKQVKQLRAEFLARGGTVGHISGDHNPADLGFHRG